MELKELIERTIDSAIRGFDPEEPESFDRWDRELRRAEDLLRDSVCDLDPLLLPSVCAERLRIAFEASRLELVVEKSAHFLEEFPCTVPSFSMVVAWRLAALHGLEAHEQELREGLKLAVEPELQGSEFIHIVAGLAKRHPGSLPADEDLWQKLRRTVADLRAQEYNSLPRAVGGPRNLEEVAGRVAKELRRLNQERGEALLSSGGGL